MAKRGENIYHRRDGRWEGRCIMGRKQNGKPKYRSVYGKTYSEAKKKLVLLKASQIDTESKPAVHSYGNGTLSDWLDYWLDVLERPYIRQTTYQLYQRNIEKHLRPLLGAYRHSELRKEHIQDAVNEMKKGLSSSTLHGIYRQLKNVLNCAVKSRLLLALPCEEIRLPKFRQKKPRVLTCAEQARLERQAAAETHLDYLLCLYTGLRLGELCALRYEDIDFETGLLHVSHAVKRVKNRRVMGMQREKNFRKTQLIVDVPKTDCSVREIPLPYFLLSMLEERMKKNGRGPGNFIFAGKQGAPADPRNIQKQFERFAMRAGVCKIHMHTLRHTFAMRCLERGMGYKALSELLGHSSTRMTMEHYDNCTQESKKEILGSAQPLYREGAAKGRAA